MKKLVRIMCILMLACLLAIPATKSMATAATSSKVARNTVSCGMGYTTFELTKKSKVTFTIRRAVSRPGYIELLKGPSLHWAGEYEPKYVWAKNSSKKTITFTKTLGKGTYWLTYGNIGSEASMRYRITITSSRKNMRNFRTAVRH